jgi:hypothetical protein
VDCDYVGTVIPHNDNNESVFYYISRHFVIDVIWRLKVWNVKIRHYLASCTFQFWSNLTKIIFHGKRFNYFMSFRNYFQVYVICDVQMRNIRWTLDLPHLSIWTRLSAKHVRYEGTSILMNARNKPLILVYSNFFLQ